MYVGSQHMFGGEKQKNGKDVRLQIDLKKIKLSKSYMVSKCK